MVIGVLALQGAFFEHIKALKELGVQALEVKKSSDLEDIDGLIIPGGESTAIGKLIVQLGLKQPLIDFIKAQKPVYGTCAGLILLASKVENETPHLNVMDIEVVRNGYGRQLGSFTTNSLIKGMNGEKFPLVFIRAPYIKEVGSNVEVLCEVGGRIVAAKEDNILVTAFHPELTDDLRVHEIFVTMIETSL